MAPHFKKLTDCPENLREAIDWLIQVRHGGDKRGLEHLAKALTSFIKEAVASAFYNILDELHNLFNPFCKYVNCCKEKITAINELNDRVNNTVNFEDQLNVVLKYVEDAKISFKRNHIVDASRNEALNAVQSRLAEFKRFKNNLDTFIGNNESVENLSKEILEKLCLGLENFLGYKSGNYTGEGIVYGDCNRFRDAVLMFMHDMLESVQDDESVNTYDSYITEPGKNLQSVINNLITSIGQGSESFNEQLKNVGEWSERYEIELEKIINNVKNPLNELLHKIKNLERNMDNVKRDSLYTQFKTWGRIAISYHEKANEVKSACDRLDGNLRDKLKLPTSLVIRSTKNLERAWKVRELVDTLNRVQKQLTEIPINLKTDIDLGVKNTVNNHDRHVRMLKESVKNDFENLRNVFLQERLIAGIDYLYKAVENARDNAIHLGGLNNEKVKAAIGVIEGVLNSEADTVVDSVKLHELQTRTVNQQTKTIKDALNEHAGRITDALKNLAGTIDGPEKAFEKHQEELRGLVDTARKDLEKAVDCAQNHAANLGWLKNSVVKTAIDTIQEQLDRVDNSIETFFQLQGLQANTVKTQTVLITAQVKSEATQVTGTIKTLCDDIGKPGDIFNRTHNASLNMLSQQSRSALNKAIENATKYVEMSHGSLQKKITKEFKNVMDGFTTGNKNDVLKLMPQIKTALHKLGEGISSNYDKSKKGGVASELGALKSIDENLITNNFLRTFNDQQHVSRSDFLLWLNSYMSHLLKSAEADITQSDRDYKRVVSSELSSIRRLIDDLTTDATNDQLDVFLTKITMFEPITAAITNYSVYDEDRKERDAYFNNLQELIKNAVNALKNAYQNAYKSSAKSYLSKAIKMIRDEVGKAEHHYAKAITDAIVEVNNAIAKFTHEKFTTKVERHKLETSLEEPFKRLQTAVREYSAFKEDFDTRETYFQQLKELITNTIKNLSEAYTDAYRSSAKTYLSKTITTIKEAVSTAEEKYISALNKEVEHVKLKVTGIEHSKLTKEVERNSLSKLFDADMKRLQEIVKANSAFLIDFTSRQTCFENLKTSLDETVKTLVVSANKFDECTKQALDYLSQSFEDAKSGVTNLGGKIQWQVAEAFDSITLEVQNLYSVTRKCDVYALKACIMDQLDEVKRIIEEDAVTGMKGLIKAMREDGEMNSQAGNENKLSDLCRMFRLYLGDILIHTVDEIKRSFRKHPSGSVYVPQFKNISENLDDLLQHIENNNFDHEFYESLIDFKALLVELAPSNFVENSIPVFQVVKNALKGFTTGLGYAYINAYSGTKWDHEEDVKYAKVFLTVMLSLYDDINELRNKCNDKGAWMFRSINMTNDLGKFFKLCGFVVSKYADSHDGEVRNDGHKLAGINISSLLGPHSSNLFESSKYNTDSGILKTLFSYISDYCKACHLKIPEPAIYPATIRDMLAWLCGLQYNAVFTKIDDHCKKIADDEKYRNDDVLLYILKLTLFNNLTATCQSAYKLLVTICSNGCGFDQADFPYACYYVDNSKSFYYPTNIPDLFDMLSDICRRLLPQLYFLYSRCRTPSKYYGWSDCSYGRNIQGHRWDCDDSGHSGDQCLSKSPLQAHLMDGLRGFLPHNVTSKSTSLSCSTCPTVAKGIPCITPMGFWDLPNSSSVTRNGSYICNVLYVLCRNAASTLCATLRCLMSLRPYPPQSLTDMFSFFSHVLQRWNVTAYGHDSKYKDAMNHAIDQCFPLSRLFHNNYRAVDLTDALRDMHHSPHDHSKVISLTTHCDLWSLTTKSSCELPNMCAPYLQPLGIHSQHTYAPKHAPLYISWFTYLAWDFWDLLSKLLTSLQTISCKTSGCSSCNCVAGNHGVRDPPPSDAAITPKPGCHCKSIVDCKGVLSTFFQYGFTFRVPKQLMESESTKTCDDFLKQLTKVLYSSYFKNLFEEIDNFLFAIRMPFFYALVTLWLLSLLYLIHIMVIRLDLLHIKSHLHSPSSHRIAAQSLLAAARVGRLAKITYLQP